MGRNKRWLPLTPFPMVSVTARVPRFFPRALTLFTVHAVQTLVGFLSDFAFTVRRNRRLLAAAEPRPLSSQLLCLSVSPSSEMPAK